MKLERIGNYIANKRKQKEMTQEQLGEKLGVSYQAVSKWERGENLPDSSLLLDLSIILDVSVDSILRGGFELPEGKRRIYVRDVQKGVRNLSQIKNLLGKDNTVYKYMIEGVSKGMNTPFEKLLDDAYLNEMLVVEILIQNSYTGHYVDPDEIRNLLEYDKCKKVALEMIEKGKPEWFKEEDHQINDEYN